MRPVLLLVLLAAGCLPSGRPVVRVLQQLSGVQTGWCRVNPLLRIDSEGGLLLPPATDLDHEDGAPFMERLLATHQRQFDPMPLEPGTACETLTAGTPPPPGPVYVLVHGIGGLGTEWMPVVPTLASSGPAALFMFRWFAYDERGFIVGQLTTGIERLAQCYPGNPIVVLGHSAGGVLGAYAASRLKLGEPPHPVDIITVASPLAGVGARPEIEAGDDSTRFFNDLGVTRRGYPAASPGVRVFHLRTTYPGDTVMKPSRSGYMPNAISATVKGSKIVDLPPTLGHNDSLLYVARQLVAGRLP